MARVETVEYPAWWAGASMVQISYVLGGSSGAVNRVDVEFLPQGVSLASGVVIPWSNVSDVQKVS